jgi:CRISPR system Cascade subunit CasB
MAERHSRGGSAERIRCCPACRFQRLMRAEGDELTALHATRDPRWPTGAATWRPWRPTSCYWEAARPRWCFQYFGADAPRDDAKESVE